MSFGVSAFLAYPCAPHDKSESRALIQPRFKDQQLLDFD
jgi:hypothetical protein